MPVAPWWDGWQWRWDQPLYHQAATASSASLYRIARVGTWLNAVITCLTALAMLTTPPSQSITSGSLRVAGLVLVVAGAGFVITAAAWRRLGGELLVMLAMSSLSAVVGWGIAVVAFVLLPLALCTVPVIGLAVARQRDSDRERAGPVGAPLMGYHQPAFSFTPAMFGVTVGSAAAGFVIGLIAAVDPSIPRSNPLPGGLVGLALGAAIGYAIASWMKTRQTHRNGP